MTSFLIMYAPDAFLVKHCACDMISYFYDVHVSGKCAPNLILNWNKRAFLNKQLRNPATFAHMYCSKIRTTVNTRDEGSDNQRCLDVTYLSFCQKL